MWKYGILDNTGKLNQLEVYIDGTEIPKGDAHLLSNMGAINVNKRLHASAMACLEQINFLNIDHPEKSFTVSTSDKVQRFSDYDESVFSSSYCGITATDEVIVALYIHHEENSSELQIFDWDGNPLCCVKIERYLDSMTIDPATNIVYANTEDEQLLAFDISELVN